MLYKYDNQFQTLQQWDDRGTLRACMSMPKSDLRQLMLLSLREDQAKIFAQSVDSKGKIEVE